MAGLPDEIPGYSEALAAEAEARDLAFLLDTPELLCGVPALPLDLRNQILLTHAENPFLVGGRADREDVRMLLYLQSPRYVEGNRDARKAFVESLPAMDEAAAVLEVRAWIDATFADAPAGKARQKGAEGAVIEEPISSFVASWVDLIASEYHWTEAIIIGTARRRGIALRRLYQYHRNIARRHDPKKSFTSGAIARLIGNWLRSSIADEAPKK